MESRRPSIIFFTILGLLSTSISFNASPIPANKPAYYPAWWFERDVIPRLNPNDAAPVYPGSYSAANDYFIINQGQTKHLATQAAAELNAHLPGGAGPALNALIQSWQQPPGPGVTREDFASVNNGQLKNLAKLFYDRLIAVGYTNAYPWANSSTPAADFSIANIGQAKNLFSFDLTIDSDADNIPDWSASDIDGDGMPSGWENANGLDPATNDAGNDPDSDGLSNFQESQMGTNPNNADSDGDGISDYYDYSPTLANPNAISGLVVTVPDYERYQNGEIQEQDIDYTKIKLKWQHDGANVTKFVIEKKVSAGNWAPVAQVAPGVHEWSDQNLLANQNYYYRLTAVNVSGAQQASSASVTTNHQVPFLKAVSMRASSLTRLKSEWSIKEFPTDLAPPIPTYYLVKTDISSFQEHDSGNAYAPILNANGSYSFTHTITPASHSSTDVGIDSYHKDTSALDGTVTVQNDSSNYNGYDQKRGKQVLTSTTQGDMLWDSTYSHNGISGNWNDVGHSSSDYHLYGTYESDDDQPRWAGNDFDMSQGTVTYSGNSYSSFNLSLINGQMTHTILKISTPDANGQWSGTKTDTQSIIGGVPVTTSINEPAWSGQWTYSGWWQGTPQVTPTQQTYSYQTSTANYQYSSGGTQTLSQEYTSQAFMDDTINDLPDWPEEFTYNYYGWGGYPWGWWGWCSYQNYGSPIYGWWLAQRNLSPSEEQFVVSKMQYKFRSSPTTTYALKWNEIFVPEDDPATPINESATPQVANTRTWNAPQAGGESPVYEIDPAQLEDEDGNYYIAFAPQWRGYNDSGTLLDPVEKTNSGLTLQKNNSTYEAAFWLSTSEVSQAKYTFSWEGNGISLWIGASGDEENWVEIQNGQTLTEEELNQLGSTFHLRVDPTQMSAAFATVTVSATDNAGTSLGEDSIVAKFLPELMVDGNRDGEMSFEDEQIHNADQTSEWGCYRFWRNVDDDGTGDGAENVGGTPDSNDNEIKSKRDLEDFTRLWLYFGGLQAGIADGTFKIGLKWKSVTGSPYIKVYRAAEADGGTQYLSNDSIAASQIGGTYKTAKATVSGANAVMLPTDVFANFSPQNPNAYLLFEGVAEGKGQLCVTLHKADGTEIGEGPGVWVDIVNVRKMYRRVKATGIADNYPEPSAITSGTPPEPAMGWVEDPNGNPYNDAAPVSWQKTNEHIIFVHGWNMDYEGSQKYAETMFKRLWQRGYKGRFEFMRWPTMDDSFFGIPYTYNASEYRAWKCGESLKQFVNSLSGSKNLVAHSMGNVVGGSALIKGMGITNYALLNAAVPAACYDDNSLLDPNWGYTTPHYDSDANTKNLSYRYKLNSVAGNLINFYLPADDALSKWEWNNDTPGNAGRFLVVGAKPQPASVTATHYYYYDPNAPAGQKLGIVYPWTVGRFVTTAHEAMSYVAQSPTKAAGANGQTVGSLNPNPVNMSQSDYNFGDVHSAEFEFTIQKTAKFYNRVLDEFDIPFLP